MQQTVLLTGATSGIGYELTRLFARDGYNLVLVARNKQKLQGMSKRLSDMYDIDVTVIEQDMIEEDGLISVD